MCGKIRLGFVELHARLSTLRKLQKDKAHLLIVSELYLVQHHVHLIQVCEDGANANLSQDN